MSEGYIPKLEGELTLDQVFTDFVNTQEPENIKGYFFISTTRAGDEYRLPDGMKGGFENNKLWYLYGKVREDIADDVWPIYPGSFQIVKQATGGYRLFAQDGKIIGSRLVCELLSTPFEARA